MDKDRKNKSHLLDQINSPEDLRKLDISSLNELCDELREFIIDEVSSNPGHFGASLGVVELTVALHYVYNTPFDKLIWDVGHQAYGHKILTGRKNIFHTNRKYGGISGFPRIEESEYDAFGVGHSSTSISAGLGMSVATDLLNETDRKVVAVIGDGSMTAGMAFEALNNAGNLKKDMLVILNDNNMAIDPNVGALQDYLVNISTSKTYNQVKTNIWNLFGKLGKIGPQARHSIQRIERGIKSSLFNNSNLFQSLNFRYFGPVDGHDVKHLVYLLKSLRDIPGPKLLHCITVKGKGYKFAEAEQTKWHAPGKFNKETGEIFKDSKEVPKPPKYQDVFGLTLVELARLNEKIVGITPAMPSGCSMTYLMKAFPERAFDVGIAEQHAVTFSAGMAIQGLIPFCNIYSSFLQRAYDQVIHDVAIQKLPVIFCIDRGGIVGEDGATHHGVFDIAYLRCIPNLILASPMNEEELRNMMYTAQLKPIGPMVIRYPRGSGQMVDWVKPFEEIPIGKGVMVSKGVKVAFLSIGPIGNLVQKAINQVSGQYETPAHFNMRFVKPLDTELLHELCLNFKQIITVEDGVISGGFGSAVLEFVSDHSYQVQVKRIGVPDYFIEHGSPDELYKECGMDVESLINTIKNYSLPVVKVNIPVIPIS